MSFNNLIINHKALNYKLCPLPLNAEGMKWMEEKTFKQQTKIWIPIKYYNHEFLKWTKSFGLSISCLEFFYNPSNHSMPVHIDGENIHDEFKLNYAFNPVGNSLMNWFKPKPNKSSKVGRDMYANDANDKFPNDKPPMDLYWDYNDVDLIESHDIIVSIVQVGYPHSVTTNDLPRKCLSCVFDKVLTPGYTTNDQIILNEDLNKIAVDRDKAVENGVLSDNVTMWEAVKMFKHFII
jgi:hypothetical protein